MSARPVRSVCQSAFIVVVLPLLALPVGITSAAEQGSVVRADKTITLNAPPPPASAQCDARMNIRFFQSNTLASVEGTIDNTTCGASGGDYELTITTRDDKGELQTREFNGSWQRSDDRPVALKADYPIGENVDLVRVRPSHISCTCSSAAVP